MDNRMKDDAALVAEAVAGDRRAFDKIVETNKTAVYSTALRITGSFADAEEVSQDVFLKIYFSLSKFRAGSALSTWIYRIAVNSALDRVRKNKRRSNVEGAAMPREDILAAPVSSASSRDISDVSSAEVSELLAGLPEKYRTPLVLREYEGLKYDEISRVIGISVGQVKIRIFRAREELKRKVSSRGEDMKSR